MRKYQLWQPYQVVQSKKVIKSQSVEVPATSMDPPHSYLSCIFLADLSQNISLSVLWKLMPFLGQGYIQSIGPIQSLKRQIPINYKKCITQYSHWWCSWMLEDNSQWPGPVWPQKNVIITPWRRLSLTKYVWSRPGAVMMGNMSPVLVAAGKSATLPSSSSEHQR